jgi:hypothetical protein
MRTTFFLFGELMEYLFSLAIIHFRFFNFPLHPPLLASAKISDRVKQQLKRRLGSKTVSQCISANIRRFLRPRIFPDQSTRRLAQSKTLAQLR